MKKFHELSKIEQERVIRFFDYLMSEEFLEDVNPICIYAKSDMTPCYKRDGEMALDDDGYCVGCGHTPDFLNLP